MCLIVRTAGPNKVLVIYGLGYDKPAFLRGGRVFQIPCFHTVEKLRLNLMTIHIQSHDVNCETGVPINVDGVAQVKVNADSDDTLQLACTHFLGMKERQMVAVISETLEGHQRGVISSMSVEEIFKDREKFAQQVRETVSQDLMRMGISIVSYTISNVRTPNGYLGALGRPQIALVQRDARIAQATNTRDAKIEEAKAFQKRDEAVYNAKYDIEIKRNARDMQHQENQKLINTEVAIANQAERLAKAEIDKVLVAEKMQIKLIEKRGEANVMDEEMKLTEQRLHANVRLQAETTQFKKIKQAEAVRCEKILSNEAEAMEIQALGEAEAEIIKLKSEAEATALAKKAKAYEQFGKAALIGEVIKTLPKIAAEIAGPCDNMNKITMVSSGDGDIGFKKVVGEVFYVMNECPNSVKTMTGIDLRAEIQKVMN